MISFVYVNILRSKNFRMKKTYFYFICLQLLFFSNSNGQINKGTLWGGTNLFWFSGANDAKDTSSSWISHGTTFTIRPKIGYFLSQQFTIGLGAEFSKQEGKTDIVTSFSNSSYASSTKEVSIFSFLRSCLNFILIIC